MPHERTPEEGVPFTKRIARAVGRGRGKDIQLPMGSREKRDPRLPRDVGGEIMEGARSVQRLMKKSNGRGKRSNGR